jgi:hypothetical protein
MILWIILAVVIVLLAWVAGVYNHFVRLRDLAIGVESFPGNIIAITFGFTKMDFFELADEAAREPVAVNFAK